MRRKETLSTTSFADGKFERYCRLRGTTVEKVARAARISMRTIQRWIRGETMPLAASWQPLAMAFGFDDVDQFWISYGDFLRATESSEAFADASAQPRPLGAYQAGVDKLVEDQIREALKSLSQAQDLDISGMKSKKRRQLLKNSLTKISMIAALLHAEHQDFCQHFAR